MCLTDFNLLGRTHSSQRPKNNTQAAVPAQTHLTDVFHTVSRMPRPRQTGCKGHMQIVVALNTHSLGQQGHAEFLQLFLHKIHSNLDRVSQQIWLIQAHTIPNS